MSNQELTVYFVRHTEPLIEAGVCYGQLDCQVTDDYVNQLPWLINYFHDKQVSTIYSSPLKRCAVLAKDIAQQCTNSDVIYKDELKEINFGDWEGVSWDDIPRSKIDEWNDNQLHFQFPNGESPFFFYQRVLSAWRGLLSNEREVTNEQKAIVIITHAGVIRTLLANIQQLPLTMSINIKIDKASVSSCCFREGFCEIFSVNEAVM